MSPTRFPCPVPALAHVRHLARPVPRAPERAAPVVPERPARPRTTRCPVQTMQSVQIDQRISSRAILTWSRTNINYEGHEGHEDHESHTWSFFVCFVPSCPSWLACRDGCVAYPTTPGSRCPCIM